MSRDSAHNSASRTQSDRKSLAQINLFLHYPSEHTSAAREVYNFVRELGIYLWFDKENLVGGDQWRREISAVIAEVDVAILITASETTKKSGILQEEIQLILQKAREFPIGQVFLINLRVENVALPPELSIYQWIDMFENDWKAALLKSLEKKFRQTSAEIPKEFELALSDRSQQQRSRLVMIDERSEHAELSASFPVFEEKDDYWNFVNAKIRAFVYEDFFRSRRMLRYYGEDQPLKEYRGGRLLQWTSQTGEFYRNDDIVSLRSNWYLDAGGAHPSHGTTTINFLGADVGVVVLEDILSHRTECIEFISKYCRDSIKLQLQALDGHQIDDLHFFDGLTNNPWLAYRNFNINEAGVVFNFSPYDILAYAYGDFKVTMPWNYFERYLAEEFKGTGFSAFVHRNLR